MDTPQHEAEIPRSRNFVLAETVAWDRSEDQRFRRPMGDISQVAMEGKSGLEVACSATWSKQTLSLSLSLSLYIYIYIYTHTHTHTHLNLKTLLYEIQPVINSRPEGLAVLALERFQRSYKKPKCVNQTAVSWNANKNTVQCDENLGLSGRTACSVTLGFTSVKNIWNPLHTF
jgi:hypothetical protein